MTTKNKMSFDVDLDNLDTDKSLREQIEDQLEENDFNDEDLNDESFKSNMDEMYPEEDEEENENDDPENDEDEVRVKTQNEEAPEEDEEDPAEVQRKELGDRANKRIRTVVAEKNQAQQEAEQARKEKWEIEKARLTDRKELLTFKVDKLKKDFENAINDGDAAKQVEINAELAKIGAQLAGVESEEQNYKEYKPKVKEQTTNPDSSQDVFGIDLNQEEAAKLSSDWEFDNPRILTDKVFHDTSMAIAKQLMSRGFRVDKPEFYTELTKRMNMAFGIQSPVKETTQQNKQQTDGANKVVVAKKNPPQKVQTVSGASRTPSPTSQSGGVSSKNGVRLDREDIATAKMLGVDLKTYASNRARVEKSMNDKGQVRIELFPED